MAGDVVDRDAVFENTQVHYNPEQKWYYLANQMPSELLIFKNADSESEFGASPGKCRFTRWLPVLTVEGRRSSCVIRQSFQERLGYSTREYRVPSPRAVVKNLDSNTRHIYHQTPSSHAALIYCSSFLAHIQSLSDRTGV
jgi:hypothetical protein